MTKPTTQTTGAEAAKAPAALDGISIDVVGNGYIVRVRRDDYSDLATVHTSAQSALDAITKALIPAPKPPRKRGAASRSAV